jgi:hypothetical protein
VALAPATISTLPAQADAPVAKSRSKKDADKTDAAAPAAAATDEPGKVVSIDAFRKKH